MNKGTTKWGGQCGEQGCKHAIAGSIVQGDLCSLLASLPLPLRGPCRHQSLLHLLFPPLYSGIAFVLVTHDKYFSQNLVFLAVRSTWRSARL